ncbi:hypothetical protein [Mumia sp. DW29H23]|uniref:hypothetical protein n=1 Tax=Mumia sp. DW29H23 TaxID=3421241 RepID=UPI003D69BC2B
MSRGLTPEQYLSIRIDATFSRSAFTKDPGPVVAAALELAGDRSDLVEEAAGRWVGYHEDSAAHAPLVNALRPYAASATAAEARHRRRSHHGGDVER